MEHLSNCSQGFLAFLYYLFSNYLVIFICMMMILKFIIRQSSKDENAQRGGISQLIGQ